MEEDFNKCLKDIGYDKKISIPRTNKSTHKDTYLSEKSIAFNRNIHDIILFIIFGLFIILTLDGIFKLACKANRKYLVI